MDLLLTRVVAPSWFRCTKARRTRTLWLWLWLVLTTGGPLATPVLGTQSPSPVPFIAFESGAVRPLALTPGGTLLGVTNIPDGRLELFQVLGNGHLVPAGSIAVGMEPVAVAALSNREMWVVNHLSDSVSVVDLVERRVVRTLLVGDEPRDIVFAGGAGAPRAFITTAHRGQHRQHESIASVPGAGPPDLTTPGVGRADVWVFDAVAPGAGIGGVPLKIVTLFGDTPRPLATSPDGSTVYAGIFHSGNQSTAVHRLMVCDGFEQAAACPGDTIQSPGGLPDGMLPGGNPGPATNHAGVPAPEVGLIVKYHNEEAIWKDELGRNWNNGVRFTLPDLDVFAIDAGSLEQTASYAHVGTILFNMVANPLSGRLYVTNTDAQNHVRFEGPGLYAGHTVQGDLARSRITVIDPATGALAARHLNKHIDYSVRPAPAGTAAHSLATPLQAVVSPDGATLYVAAFGSGRVGRFPTAALEEDTFDPTLLSASYMEVSGGGPAGLALDATGNWLYVYTRFDNGVSVVNTASGVEQQHVALFSPEPPNVVQGRPMLYDARATSSNGEASCASCHVFGDTDSLSWDLGNPDEEVRENPIPVQGGGPARPFHPMKGPMTTQTLRGLIHSGAMHWRGDRSTGYFGVDPTDSALSFNNFIVALPGLVGADLTPDDPAVQAEMQRFTDFALALTLPPNPVRNLNNTLTPQQQVGFDFFHGERRSDGFPTDADPDVQTGFTCAECHVLDPAAGLYGTSRNLTVLDGRPIKIPHTRNLYQKVGMFGMPGVSNMLPNQDFSFMGNQVRGSGYTTDGSTDTLFRFFTQLLFRERPLVGFDGGHEQLRAMEAYMLAFESDLAPIVGQQVTVSRSSPHEVHERVTLLRSRAQTVFVSRILGGTVTECDLVAHSAVRGRPISWLYDPASDRFLADRTGELSLPYKGLLRFVHRWSVEATFTCVPPGSGVRVGLDRDLDGVLNRDEPGA